MHNLEPSCVWSHFATLCDIPRSSCHEAALRTYLISWGQARGLSTVVDDVGNLILSKPASPGCEAAPGVILQGHLDMVCQANAGITHDFARDPINPVVRDGWLMAEHTTLGADNGIGVALALAALEVPLHPSLEVLLTVNEEAGMDGARGLVPGTLRGQRLINLDTEEWGYFYLGCAGGVDVEICHDFALENLPSGFVLLRINVSGLRGGHSGIDIQRGRGNAIRLLSEALRDLAVQTDLRLLEMKGGTARNAIPREASALCALPAPAASGIESWMAHRLQEWQQRFAQDDARVMLRYELDDAMPCLVVSIADRDRMLSFLDIAPNGVALMSEDFPGVVDTSANLGVVQLVQGMLRATFKVRSLHDARADALADQLLAHAASYGLSACKDGMYPGWIPDASSPLLSLCQQVYAAQFGSPANLQVIHAGLECGLFAVSHPHLDMISFGPDIRSAHAPGESVNIESVVRCWNLLQALLQELAREAHA